MFVDKVKVKVKAGKGGDGVVSFRHEKFVDKGGPDGGDGGDGGDVVFEATTNINSLSAFRTNQQIFAKDGQPGSKRNKHGKNGEDIIIKVPVGTIVYDDEQAIADLNENGQTATVAFGGQGGFGNAHFKSSRRTVPKIAERGEKGDEFDAVLELKMIADVGLIGFPNAGKSTLLSVISNAKPQIANYAFTTLTPNLGVVDLHNSSILVADIPGLIEGASKGKGLGDEFLRHIERTKVLIHLVDAYSDDIANSYKVIRNELKTYKLDLAKKPEIVAMSKVDGLDKEILEDQISQLKKVAKKVKIIPISSLDKTGITELLDEAVKQVNRFKVSDDETEEDKPFIEVKLPQRDRWKVEKIGDHFRVSGKKIEKFAARTKFENEYGVLRLKDIMRKMGITQALIKQGIKTGDKIKFRGIEESILF